MADVCGSAVVHNGRTHTCDLEPGHSGVHVNETETICWTKWEAA